MRVPPPQPSPLIAGSPDRSSGVRRVSEVLNEYTSTLRLRAERAAAYRSSSAA